jgi:hypothetical protein
MEAVLFAHVTEAYLALCRSWGCLGASILIARQLPGDARDQKRASSGAGFAGVSGLSRPISLANAAMIPGAALPNAKRASACRSTSTGSHSGSTVISTLPAIFRSSPSVLTPILAIQPPAAFIEVMISRMVRDGSPRPDLISVMAPACRSR